MSPIVIAALVAVFVGLLLLVLVMGGLGKEDTSSGRMRRRLKHVTTESDRVVASSSASSSSSGVAKTAVELSGRLTAKADWDITLSNMIAAAGLKWSPAEWLLLHLGIAVGAGLVTALLTGFSVLPTLLAVAAGVAGPMVYLSIAANKRRARFNAGLADMLQLMAGSLSSGYSVPQAFDTVVNESEGPIADELDKALLQTRLGVPLEDALNGVAERMRSVDFAWIVMAIRVQREIGGNLAEVLTNVAETLRERDRIKRQVKALSAEGVLSGWILGLLPVAFALYLAITRPEYLGILFTTTMGLVLLVGAILMLGIGVFWMTRIVKVEV